MVNDFEYQLMPPPQSLADFVESFWMLRNHSGSDKEIVVLPDGRLDLFFSRSQTEPFRITLSGLETRPSYATLGAGTLMFAISFKLPAAEYIFQNPVSGLLDSATRLPADFWSFQPTDLENFERFCKKASQTVSSLMPEEVDRRKQKLFRLIYSSGETLTVKALSEKAGWSSRQINRYFNGQFGLSLKAYCNILRFRASFQHIREGKLFPQNHFADQSHFIKAVKRLSGASPKELKRNKNDRFIQLSTFQTK